VSTAPSALQAEATIGILGGGQLGRMLALAAARLGFKCHIFSPSPDSPAFDVVHRVTCADYTDTQALDRFAADVDIVTYEFENVPAETATFLAARVPVLPDPKILATTQDRLAEKKFVASLGIGTAPFADVGEAAALKSAIERIGRPAVLKTRRFGYDGKGQALVREGSDLSALYRALGGEPSVLEGFVRFEREVSLVAARGLDGEFAAFDLCENEHEHHILARTRLPAAVAPATEIVAREIARQISEALGYVGVLAVEMFVIRGYDGVENLIVNEIAPRVHNSGHWTIDGALTSQFEQHVRAIAGWPLGAPTRLGAIEMRNLIGVEAESWRDILADPGLHLHLYGKVEARPGRKMGHVTRISPSPWGLGAQFPGQAAGPALDNDDGL
jgi:5-(carboxyamino)imidazole ribonucleotide synthase